MQQFNLDWIMQQLHKMLQFMPMNGAAGDVLQRNVDGAVWMPLPAVSLDIHSMNTIPDVEGADELAIYDNSLQGNYKVKVSDVLAQAAVQSVNGQTGAVVLDAADVSALPDTTAIPSDTSDLTNGAGFVNAAGAAAAAPVQSVNGQTGAVIVSGGAVDSVNGKTGTVVLDKTDIGLGNVDNVQQYSASNPPPYPVTSVNGQTGDVIVSGGGGSSLFNTDQVLTISSQPADVTVTYSGLYGAVSTDGSLLRIYGVIKTTCPTSSSGWQDFVVTGVTVTPPAAIRAIYNCGWGMYSPTGVDPNEHMLSDQYGYVRIRVMTDGTIRLGVYYPFVGTSDIFTFSFMPFNIPLA